MKLALSLNPLQRRVVERAGLPVMHGAYPLIGHLPALATDLLAFERRGERELGALWWSHGGFGQWQLHCLVPEAFEIFRNPAVSSAHVRQLASQLFGEAVIGQDGERHRDQRSALGGAFTPRSLAEARVGELFAEVIDRHLGRWLSRPSVRLLPETRELVLALIFRMLGIPEQDLEGWRRDYEQIMVLALNPRLDLPGTPRRRGVAARERLEARLGALIRNARSRSDAQGFFADLVRGRDERGQELAGRDLSDNIRLLILAGHETTASTIAWMTLLLAEHPWSWDALCTEADAASDVPRSPADLKRFPYAEAVFREALRLYPPVARNIRVAEEDLHVNGRTVPRGTHVSIPIMHLQRRSDLHERPDDFVPERWLGRSTPPSPIELSPFGGGHHFCLGYHVAWMECVLYAVTLARMLNARGLQPVLDGPPPRPWFVPLLHPGTSTRVRFARRGKGAPPT